MPCKNSTTDAVAAVPAFAAVQAGVKFGTRLVGEKKGASGGCWPACGCVCVCVCVWFFSLLRGDGVLCSFLCLVVLCMGVCGGLVEKVLCSSAIF